MQWENFYGDWAPQELGRWALWNTKKAIRHPYPLPRERFHYRGEDALSSVRSVVCRRVLDGERRVSDPVYLEHAVDERGRTMWLHTYNFLISICIALYFHGLPVLFCFFSRGNRGELRWRPGRALPLALCRRTRSSEHHWEFQFTHLHLILFNRPSFEREWL